MDYRKGLVTKIKEDYCIVVTKDGQFRRLPLPKETIRVGQEIPLPNRTSFFNKFSKYGLLVATLLLAFLGFSFLQQKPEQMPVAYISLDINPSVELAVDNNHKILQTKAYNDDGKILLSKASIINLNLYQGLQKLMEQAVTHNYIKADRKNIIVSAVYSTSPETSVIDNNKVTSVVSSALNKGAYAGEVVLYQVDGKIRTEAARLSMTMGKTVIYEAAKDQGSQVELKELKGSSISKLVSQGKLKDPQEYTKVKNLVNSSITKVGKHPGNSKGDDHKYSPNKKYEDEGSGDKDEGDKREESSANPSRIPPKKKVGKHEEESRTSEQNHRPQGGEQPDRKPTTPHEEKDRAGNRPAPEKEQGHDVKNDKGEDKPKEPPKEKSKNRPKELPKDPTSPPKDGEPDRNKDKDTEHNTKKDKKDED